MEKNKSKTHIVHITLVFTLIVVAIFLFHTVQAAGDFTISANPTTLNFNSGSSGTSTISLNSTGGFAGPVNLQVIITPTTGLSCDIIPSSISLTTSATATLVCTGSTVGSYTVIVTGQSGPLSHSVAVTVNVQDFTISANPTTINTPINTPNTSTISITALNGFNGTVSLTVSTNPGGPSCSLSPTSVSLPPSPSTTTLTCSAPSQGNYSVAVTGTSGSLSHTANLVLQITDFTIKATPSSLYINSGSTGISTITLTSRNGFSGTIALSVLSTPPGLSCSLNPTSVTITTTATSNLSCSGSGGTFTITVTGTSGNVIHSTILTATVQDFTISSVPSVTMIANTNGTARVDVNGINNFNGEITLTTNVSPTGLSCLFTPSMVALPSVTTSTLSCNGSAGVYSVIVTGVNGTLSHSTTVTFTVEDLDVVAATTGVSIASGTSGSTTIIVVSLDGYTGPVTLATNISPNTGLTCSLTPTSIVLGTFGTSTLTCHGNPGTYNVTITAVGSSLSHRTSVAYTIESPGGISSGQPFSLEWFAIITGLVASGLIGTVMFRRFNVTTTPFDNGFYNMVGGELHSPGAILILGDPGTGTTTLGLELLQHDLNNGKHCGLITYDAFPSELMKRFNNLGIDVSKHVENETLKMIDCYSALIGDEKAQIKDAVDFTEISIQVTRIIEAAKGPITLLLDSVNPIFNSTQPNTVINFLRVLGAKIKNNGGLFIMTGTRRSMAEEVTSKVEVVVDTVIELNMARKGNDIIRTLSFRKMAGHHYSMAPAEFKIIPSKGIMFKKHRITFPRQRPIQDVANTNAAAYVKTGSDGKESGSASPPNNKPSGLGNEDSDGRLSEWP